MGRQSKSIRRERFRMAKMTEIAASVGQKILFSRRGAMIAARFPSTASGATARRSAIGPVVAKINNGDTMAAKTHAAIGAIVGAKSLAECVEAFGILSLYWRPPSAAYAPSNWARPRHIEGNPRSVVWIQYADALYQSSPLLYREQRQLKSNYS